MGRGSDLMLGVRSVGWSGGRLAGWDGWEWIGYERAGREWIRTDFLITVEENGGC